MRFSCHSKLSELCSRIFSPDRSHATLQPSRHIRFPRFLNNLAWLFLAVLLLSFPARIGFASTIETNSRAEVSFMASLWETDTITISPLANAQYPVFSTDWQ